MRLLTFRHSGIILEGKNAKSGEGCIDEFPLGYSYFFTDLLTNFAPSFDTGSIDGTHDRFRNRFDLLLQTSKKVHSQE